MDPKTFEAFFDMVYDRARSLTIGKNKEYARGDNKLHNFTRAAAMDQCTPEHALKGMLIKHDVSVLDMLDDLDKGIDHSIPKWEEKIFDRVVYNILLLALLYDRYVQPHGGWPEGYFGAPDYMGIDEAVVYAAGEHVANKIAEFKEKTEIETLRNQLADLRRELAARQREEEQEADLLHQERKEMDNRLSMSDED
jgi:hypothetical protein